MSRVWRIRLPAGVRPPYEVFVNGVPQELGRDYRVIGGELLFERELAREQLKKRAWILGLLTGIGTYEKRDTVDVRYEVGGAPRLAHDLEVIPPS